jgi:serine/threonine-protein kinase
MLDLKQRIQDAFGGRLVVERELGGGGMSRVFLASAVGVRRRVVVKVLPPELSVGVNAERFRREIDLAAQLQHPHIVPLLEVGQDEDLLCYSMPYIEGESLRARLERDRGLPIGEAVRLWRELLDALSCAHGRGVVHRDIKPENVLLSGKHAVVTDFGVARALGESAQGAARATSTGMSIGTPMYMAPEQAAGDPNVDHRADLYAAGLVMWELLAGRHPFAGLGPTEVIAAQVTRMPERLTDVRPSVPAGLAVLVERCLAKHPGDRPASADELLAAIEGLPITDSGRSMTDARAPGARYPVSRNLIGGAVAVIALAALTVAAFLRSGIAPASATALNDARVADSIAAAARDDSRSVGFLSNPVVPADEPLRRQAVDLVMSVFRRDTTLFLAGPEELAEGLRVLRYPEAFVTHPDTQAALVKDGTHATVRLALARFGGSFTVSLEFLRNDRSATVGSFTADAPDSSSLPGALRQVADSAYGAFRRVAKGLQLPNTSRWGSPAAWKLLDDAAARNSARDYIGAVQLARAATRADSSNVRAWISLSIYLANSGLNRAERLDAISRAYRLGPKNSLEGEARAKVTYWQALNRSDQALAAIDSLLQLASRYNRAIGPISMENTAGNLRSGRREFAAAESHFRQGIARRRGGTVGFEHTNLLAALLNQGKIAEADSVYRVIDSIGTPGPLRTATWARAVAVHDHEALARHGLSELTGEDTSTSVRMTGYTTLRTARIMQGRFREADSLLVAQTQVYMQIGDRRAALVLALTRTRIHAVMREDTARARGIMADAIQRYLPATMPFMDRPYELLIIAHTALGDLSRAKAYAAEWDKNVPAEYRNIDAMAIENALGDIDLIEGRAEQALQRYRTRTTGACFTCDMPDIAQAFHMLGRTDSAIVYYERYVSTPNTGRQATDAFRLAEAYLRLGELYEARGDLRNAIARYEDLVELWKNADPDRQSVVADVRRTVQRLRTRTG